MAYVDYKTTIWERIHIADSDVEEVKRLVDSGELVSTSQLAELALRYETLAETSEELPVEENDGQSTIEVYNADSKMVAENGTKLGNR